MESLQSACRRLHEISPRPHLRSALYLPDDGRLLCLVDACTAADVQRLFAVALLPSPRILGVVVLQVNGPERERG
jgi:hypothetical protein